MADRVDAEAARVMEQMARKVTALREARGMTSAELADAAGIQPKTLRDVEYARSSRKREDGSYAEANPTLHTIYCIASALDVEVGYLADPDRPIEPPSDG